MDESHASDAQCVHGIRRLSYHTNPLGAKAHRWPLSRRWLLRTPLTGDGTPFIAKSPSPLELVPIVGCACQTPKAPTDLARRRRNVRVEDDRVDAGSNQVTNVLELACGIRVRWIVVSCETWPRRAPRPWPCRPAPRGSRCRRRRRSNSRSSTLAAAACDRTLAGADAAGSTPPATRPTGLGSTRWSMLPPRWRRRPGRRTTEISSFASPPHAFDAPTWSRRTTDGSRAGTDQRFDGRHLLRVWRFAIRNPSRDGSCNAPRMLTIRGIEQMPASDRCQRPTPG